ncbi:hypothetical protein [Cognatishimia activa]|uniref:SatD family (SatD) n=1 Tax=Cognatishimia activa TaxID=1715691 RepID=A0A0P1IUD7_9RHOB|nr:hypothetical protein [Cognatishimia activa]CUJ33871.1 hypothetical protein TA5113_03089 [Cognatishimia activa]CUK27093.1 hypothetical protein TA5114_02914 [Cognatishimia activa]
MSEDTQQIAVLTGDIVGSTQQSSEDLADIFQDLHECALVIETLCGGPIHLTRHRGDGWQIALPQKRFAIRSALLIRAKLKSREAGLDSYIGIAFGETNTELQSDLNLETSETFQRSGWALEDVKSSKWATRMITQESPSHDAILALLDHMIRSWTQTQSAEIYEKFTLIPTKSDTDIAKALGKSRQAVSKSLKSTGADRIELALGALEFNESQRR